MQFWCLCWWNDCCFANEKINKWNILVFSNDYYKNWTLILYRICCYFVVRFIHISSFYMCVIIPHNLFTSFIFHIPFNPLYYFGLIQYWNFTNYFFLRYSCISLYCLFALRFTKVVTTHTKAFFSKKKIKNFNNNCWLLTLCDVHWKPL